MDGVTRSSEASIQICQHATSFDRFLHSGGVFRGFVQVLLGTLDVIERGCDGTNVQRWGLLALERVTKLEPPMVVIQQLERCITAAPSQLCKHEQEDCPR